MPFSSNVTRAISLSVVWGTLLATHLRRRRKEPENQDSIMSLEDQFSSESSEALLHSTDASALNGESEDRWNHQSAYVLPAERTHTDPALMLLYDSTSMFRRVLSVIGSFVSPTPAEEQAVVALVDRQFAESMNVIKSVASSLDLPTHMPESFYAKLPFRRSNSNNNLKSLMEDFELLTFYSKSNDFLKAVAPANTSLEFVQHVLDKLENVAITLLATYFPVDELEEASARSSPSSTSERLNLLLCLDVPATRDLTPFPPLRPKKDHLIRFGYCQYQFASFLAHLSIMPESVETLSLSTLEPWLDLWSASQDIRLQLLSSKIKYNLQAHKRLAVSKEEPQGEDMVDSAQPSNAKKPFFYLPSQQAPSPNKISETVQNGRKDLNPPVIYGPDVFKLDKRDDGPNSPPPEFDVIFLNGMLGSVFHTWRQSDLCGPGNEGEDGSGVDNSEDSSTNNLRPPATFPGQVCCWPQAWLSEEFPNARIIGINVNLKPFIWNPICPAEKTKRRIDQRAKDILQQLLMAGVGRRPIIWVAHSAGGILTKELIKLSATWFTGSPSTNNVTKTTSPSQSTGLLESMPSATSSSPTVIPTSSSAVEYSSFDDNSSSSLEDRCMDMATLLSECEIDFEHPGSIAEQTRGIIFLSVPHRGNQSMMFLYQFPMVFTLTPEAKQLQQNNAAIVGLHNWFLDWTARHPIQVLNMVENKETVVNRWYSVHLVLPEPQDTEFSEVVLMKTDHAGICKPKSPEDDIYLRIAGFIHNIFDDS